MADVAVSELTPLQPATAAIKKSQKAKNAVGSTTTGHTVLNITLLFNNIGQLKNLLEEDITSPIQYFSVTSIFMSLGLQIFLSVMMLLRKLRRTGIFKRLKKASSAVVEDIKQDIPSLGKQRSWLHVFNSFLAMIIFLINSIVTYIEMFKKVQ